MSDDAEPEVRGANRVRFGDRAWELDIGVSITFGRARDSDIVISREPPDLVVSRRAGRLTAVEGGLLITNESERRSLYLQAIPGPEFEIKPRMTLGTMPFEQSRIVVLGVHGARYVLGIVCRVPTETATTSQSVLETRAATGVPTTSGYRRLNLPDAQRRYLAALCEPILTGIGAKDVPATYGQIAKRCGVSPKTVRNSLDSLRQMLSVEYGIPNLAHVDGSEVDRPGTVNFLSALAAWAIHSGNITREDLESLDP